MSYFIGIKMVSVNEHGEIVIKATVKGKSKTDKFVLYEDDGKMTMDYMPAEFNEQE